MQRHRDQHLGQIKHLCDLPIGEIFEVAQSEYFGRSRTQLREGPAQTIAQLARLRVAALGRKFVEREVEFSAPGPQHVERRIHRSAAKVALLTNQGDG